MSPNGPDTPREHRLAADGGDICWFEWGERGNAPSLFLIHATGFHARIWDQIVAHLPPDTHVIAPDLLGHGRSSRPASLWDWRATSDALLPLLDLFAGTRLVGCGHSMGGYALVRLASERPAAFQHIVLIDPTIFAPSSYAGYVDTTVPDPADNPVARRRNIWDGPDQMIARFADRPPYAAWQPEVLADYATHGLRASSTGQGWELACPPVLEASVYQGAGRINPHAWLPRLTAPTTIIRARNSSDRSGALDFSQSPTWPELGKTIGAVNDEQWADHSHFIPMETPQRVAQMLATILAEQNQG